MAIITPKNSDEKLSLITDALDEIRNFPYQIAESIRDDAERLDLNIALPMGVYTLYEDPDARLSSLESARLSGWRTLLLNSEAVFGAIELSRESDGDSFSFSNLDDGFLVHSTVRALIVAERFEKFQEDDFELRMLRIPEQFFHGLWFARRLENFFIPLSFRLVPVNLFSILTLEELIDQLYDT